MTPIGHSKYKHVYVLIISSTRVQVQTPADLPKLVYLDRLGNEAMLIDRRRQFCGIPDLIYRG